jgi:hypothetical protein
VRQHPRQELYEHRVYTSHQLKDENLESMKNWLIHIDSWTVFFLLLSAIVLPGKLFTYPPSSNRCPSIGSHNLLDWENKNKWLIHLFKKNLKLTVENNRKDSLML